ncbi:P-loop containing nucleoside triphosphate hydrolase protein [Fimicolochytrium jonesii]|uniref:P-loop containing nucleoside triphosphate hydrolase protein n=1 Tax=Fimicolochytrium jonesii TaxID=1396493 RepID=UPI0022FE3D0B|nr:P-loop containing nucleoside triphosphate hydrolase protein [Fimicolochytrium jonesii]KAI8816707.1 P-loop containing nucleoside triphosphate hydrolase protein [Fimicolochytrium jonesii]
MKAQRVLVTTTNRPSDPTTRAPTRNQQALKVVVRVRPPKNANCELAATVEENSKAGKARIVIPKPFHDNGTKAYSFDKVYGPKAGQADVFVEVENLLKDVFDGKNATVFAYGQTGSGKTHTMNAYSMTGSMNNPTITIVREDAGITYRAVDWIFDHIQRHELNARVCASFLEIYNDEVYDLLPRSAATGELRKLRLMTAGRKVTVQGLSEEVVADSAAFEKLFVVALLHRTTAGTKLNVLSSRSHFMVQLTIRIAGEHKDLTSKLALIDLAGSEDNRYTGNEGERFEESRHINASLFAIRNVVSALKDSKAQIPYRNSKITQLLCDSLGGTASSLAVVCCAPELDNLHPTHNSLEFAKDCCFIKNCVEVNEVRRKPRISDNTEKEMRVPEAITTSERRPSRDNKENESSEQKVSLKDVEKLFRPMMETLIAEREIQLRRTLNTEKEEQQVVVDNILRVMNTAGLKELKALKMIGTQRANKIIQARETKPFETPHDLMRIGLSQELLNTILQINFQMPMNIL